MVRGAKVRHDERHSPEGGNPFLSLEQAFAWVPAFAGTTAGGHAPELLPLLLAMTVTPIPLSLPSTLPCGFEVQEALVERIVWMVASDTQNRGLLKLVSQDGQCSLPCFLVQLVYRTRPARAIAAGAAACGPGSAAAFLKGQFLVPALHLVQTGQQPAEADAVERSLGFLLAEAVRWIWIGEHASQASHREIRRLRQE